VVEDPGGADAVGDAADDEFEVVVVGGDGGDGVAAHDGIAALVFGGLELDILAGFESDFAGFEELHAQLDDVVGEGFFVEEFGAEAGDVEKFVGDYDPEVAADLDLAGEADAGLAFLGGEVGFLDGADHAAAFADGDLAVGAGAAAAAGGGDEDVVFGEEDRRESAFDGEVFAAAVGRRCGRSRS
jgi:hypothetical protein